MTTDTSAFSWTFDSEIWHWSVDWFLQEANAALQAVQGYKLDKSHIFAVSKFDDFDKYARVPDEYSAQEAKEYEPKVSVSVKCSAFNEYSPYDEPHWSQGINSKKHWHRFKRLLLVKPDPFPHNYNWCIVAGEKNVLLHLE